MCRDDKPDQYSYQARYLVPMAHVHDFFSWHSLQRDRLIRYEIFADFKIRKQLANITWYNQLASVGHYLHKMFFIPLGLLVIKSNSCQQTSMIWGNTGYEVVEIDLSFLKTKQDKLHQIHQNLNIYFFLN